MATPTSSSNRSKRKTTKPVTKGQEPQRSNRQKVSKAQVTNSTNRGSNAGSAKVTTGRGASQPAPKALPPGTKGGPLATQGRTPLKGQPQLPPGRKGGSMEKVGPTVDVKANTPKLKGSNPKPSGNFKAPNIPKPTAAAGAGATARALSRVASGARNLLGNAMVPLAMAGEVSAMMDRDRRWNEYKDRNYGNTRVKPKPGDAQSRFAGAREANLNRINNDPRFAAPKAQGKPKAEKEKDRAAAAAAPSLPRAVTAPRTSRPASTNAPSSSPTLRKGEDQSKNRGSYATQFKEENGRMAAASMVRQQNRGNMTSEDLKPKQNDNIKTNYDGGTNVYEPKTKVNAPNYSKAKIDQKKVDEYGRRKKRYYD